MDDVIKHQLLVNQAATRRSKTVELDAVHNVDMETILYYIASQ